LATNTSNRPLRLLHLAACALLLSLGAPTALAQSELPPAVIQSTTLNDAERAQAEQYAAAALELLKSQTWSESKRGRDQLLRPLENTNASVAFRLAYTRVLVPDLERQLAPANPDLTRINALRILGSLATAQAAAAIEPHLADKSPSIRFMAASAAGTALRSLSTGSPALPSGDAVRLVNRLDRQLQTEADPLVLDGLVVALIDATRVEIANYTELRDTAYQKLVTTMSARVQSLPTDTTDEQLLATLLRVGVAARDGLIGRAAISQSLTRDLAAYGGDLITYVVRRAKAGTLPPAGDTPLRLAHEQFVAVGEAAVFFALVSLQPTSRTEPTAIAEKLRDPRPEAEQEMIAEANTLISSVLTRAPLNLPAARFQN
jgi:hypothetical protein